MAITNLGLWRYPVLDCHHWYFAFRLQTAELERTRAGAVRHLTLRDARQRLMVSHWEEFPELYIWAGPSFANLPHTDDPEIPAVEGPDWPDPVLMRRDLFDWIVEGLQKEAQAKRAPRKAKSKAPRRKKAGAAG